VPQGPQAPEISELAYAATHVTPGTLFFCVPGFTRDGHDFAQEAIAKGAVALVVERSLSTGIPEIQVPSVRAAMATVAAAFYGDPTNDLQTVGVTGTNGKTTTTFLIRALLEADHRQTGLLGTVKSIVGGVEHAVQRTTPEAIDLQRAFREMHDLGDVACVLEVSSHALELHRADAIHFTAAVFTNLTHDHLDFHPTMEQYFNAKRRLFTDLNPERTIINIDDAYGSRLAKELQDPITVALRSPTATYRATDVQTGLQGSSFTVRTQDGDLMELKSPLRGTFNVYNVLGAFATAGIVRQFYLGVRGRRRALGESGPRALGRATRSNPRLYGGLVVHFGVVLIAVALAASSAHGASKTVRLRVDESATVAGYKFTYVGATTEKSGQKTTVSVGVRVQKGDRDLGVYAPAVSTYPNSTEGIGTPSVHTGLREDVYLTLVSSPNQQGRVTLGIRINTMIVWLWIGGGVMAIGTVLALLPSLRRRPRREAGDPGDPDAEPVDELEEVTA